MIDRKSDEYLFADAFIGCQQAKLMNWQDYIRLANLGDLESAHNALLEFGYGDPTETKHKGDIEEFIRREQAWLYEMIFRNMTGREEMAPYLYPFDYHNLKACLKAEVLGRTPDENLLISTGDIDWMTTVAMVRDRNYASLRPTMRDAVQEATDLYGRSQDPQAIDLILDKACYKDLVLGAEETGSEFILEFVRTRIDTLNLKLFARVRKMNKGWAFFKNAMLPEGFLKEDFFLSNFDDSMTQLADKINQPYIKAAVAEGGRILEETGKFTRYEKLLDDAVMEVNKKAKFYTEGIEPIAGYWFAKETELDNLRIILNGLKIHSEPEKIIEFLREPYV